MRSEIFKAKLAQDPNNLLYQFSLGQALFEEEQYTEASDQLQACVKSRPDWMVAHILLGKSLLASGATEAAKNQLIIALNLAREQHHEGPEEELETLLATLKK